MVYISSLWHLLLVHCIYELCAYAAVTITKPPILTQWDSSDELHLAEGDPLTLRCPIKSSGADSFRWFKDGKPLKEASNNSQLHIPFLTANHTAAYRCFTQNQYGAVISSPVLVYVLYINGFLLDEDDEVRVGSGNAFILRAPPLNASSHLNLSWKWFFEDAEIVINDTHYITSQGDLLVTDSTSRFGAYRCLVSANGHTFNSPVQYVLQDERSTAGEFSTSFGIIYSPLDATYRVGDSKSVDFDCVPSRWDNDVSVEWQLNGVSLEEDNDNIKLSNGRRKLSIESPHLIAQNDNALITCTALDHLSQQTDSVDAQLHIIRRPVIDRSAFRRKVSQSEGHAIKLPCSVVGVPEPTVHWYRNGVLLSDNSSTLVIPSSNDQLSSVYECEAQNEAGFDIASVWVTKIANDFMADDSSVSSLRTASSLAPLIVNGPSNQSVNSGDEVTLVCKASGHPTPSVVWKHNGSQLLTNTKYTIDDHSLRILSLTPSDSGEYSCTASNENGNDRASAFVSVIGLDLIEFGPTNQSILIGSNVIMPCSINRKYGSNDGLVASWKWNGHSIPITGDAVRRFIINADGSLAIKQVGPDNIGLYTCTIRVANQEQSISAWLRIIEKPSMPQSVFAELLNETIPAKVRVWWREGFDGNSPLIKHIVQMRSIGPTGLWSDWETIIDNVPSELCCSTVVDNLKPSSTVEFRIVAVNRHGAGKPSLPSNNVTLPQQPPAAAPRNVAASARSWSSIMVQWQPPPSEQWNGDILGYIIRYRLANYAGLPWLEKNVSNGHARNIPLEHLITWREYEIQVCAYNDRGMGVFSKPLYVTTLEGVPTQAPSDIRIKIINSTALAVSFVPPDQQMIPGVNQGYKIELWKGEISPTKLYRQIRVLPDQQNITTVIGGLEKFGHYNITVLCFTSPGDGPRSQPTEAITMEDLPSAIESINFDMVLSNSAVVLWNPPAEPNGIITKYTVRYWEDSNPSKKRAKEVRPDTHEVTLDDLNASTRYTVDVQAWTKVGAGPRTEGRFESGVPPELPGRASSLIVTDVRARSVNLQFVPGFDGHTLIRKWIVEAKVASSSIFVAIFNISAPKARSFTVKGLRPYTKYQLRLIAENIRGRGAPSEPSREFDTKQSEPEIAPEKVFAEPHSSTSVAVSWSPLHPTQWNGEPRGYLIVFRNSDQQKWHEMRTSNIKESDFILSELRPFTDYEVRLVAENSLGRSNFSASVFAKTYEDVPSGSPSNVQATVDSHRRAVVSWNALKGRATNGVILGYKVRVVPEEERLRGEFTRTSDVSDDTAVLQTVFTQLRPFTAYRVYVSAYTIVGQGPENKSAPLIQTGEDTPGEPYGVAFSYISESEVRLKWMPPLNPNGRILKYEIAYWKPGMKQDALKILLPYNVFGFSATGLQPETRYLFAVSAENSIGWGSQTVVTVVTTLTRVPPPSAPQPYRNPARVQSSTSIYLKWSHPSLPDDAEDAISPVRSVDVEYQMHNSTEWISLPNAIPASLNEVTINGLHPDTPYRARIRLVCDFAQSSWSLESQWVKTLEAAPSSAPSSIQASPYESSALLLQWSPPHRSDWNSDKITYRILYRPYPSNETFGIEDVTTTEETLPKMQHIIRRLQSFRHYIVQMQTVNEKGVSESSTPVFVYVGYSIPKRRVTNLVAEPLSSTAVQVRWDPWIALPDDVISGFRIRYTPIVPILSDEQNLEEVIVAENNTASIVEMRKFTEYQISVVAYNRAGEGEASVVRVTTMEDRPGVVGHLKFSDILLDSVNVSWMPPSEPNGRIQAYIVNYRTFKLREEFKKEVQEKTTETEILVENLEENVTYFFTVKAETIAGYGEGVTGNVTIGPNPGCPEAPTKPNVIPGQMSVTLQWDDKSHGASLIKAHLIQAKRIARAKDLAVTNKNFVSERSHRATRSNGRVSHVIGNWVTIAKVRNAKPTYEINYRELEPSSLYVFRVFAVNSVGIGYASPETEQLHVPATLPDEPFFTKWWFIVMIAMLTFVVVILVVALLCITGSRYKDEKRNSVDSLQLADGGIVSYELRASKRRNLHHTRHDLPIRPNTNTSWISDAREPPAYGSIVDVDSADRTTTNIFGTLATDLMPSSVTNSARTAGGTTGAAGSSNLLAMGIGRPLSTNTTFINQDSMFDSFSADGEGTLDNDDDEEASGYMERETSIAQHYEHEDAYRSTWRKARAEAIAESAPVVNAQSNNNTTATTPTLIASSNYSRPGSSESNRSELMMITTARSNNNQSSLMNGFSSFV